MSANLSAYLVPEGVLVNQTAAGAAEIIRLLADNLARRGIVRPSYAAAAIAREAEMPTGLPFDDELAVAVPHTDPEHVIRPGVALATLLRPVAFGSMDDPEVKLPARIVFALALRDKNEQIDMLQAVAGLLQNPQALKRLCVARSADEAIAIVGAAP